MAIRILSDAFTSESCSVLPGYAQAGMVLVRKADGKVEVADRALDAPEHLWSLALDNGHDVVDESSILLDRFDENYDYFVQKQRRTMSSSFSLSQKPVRNYAVMPLANIVSFMTDQFALAQAVSLTQDEPVSILRPGTHLIVGTEKNAGKLVAAPERMQIWAMPLAVVDEYIPSTGLVRASINIKILTHQAVLSYLPLFTADST